MRLINSLSNKPFQKFVSNLFQFCFRELSYHSKPIVQFEVKKTMNTKLIVALVIVGVLAVAIVGLVSAQIATQTPIPRGTAPNGAPYNGFFGWMGRCFGYRGATYYGTQAPADQAPLPANITVTNPYTNQTTTYQGSYGYGYGGCMRGFYP